MAKINEHNDVRSYCIVMILYSQSWQHAIIIPTHKSGETEEPTNFRPNNLLPILSILLEKAIYF